MAVRDEATLLEYLEGKPFYRRCPRETEEQARRIVSHLQQHCGSGNFAYLVMLGEAGDIADRLDIFLDLSTMAVFPTPASPSSTGLFLVRRHRI
jgi:hypothetical protein